MNNVPQESNRTEDARSAAATAGFTDESLVRMVSDIQSWKNFNFMRALDARISESDTAFRDLILDNLPPQMDGKALQDQLMRINAMDDRTLERHSPQQAVTVKDGKVVPAKKVPELKFVKATDLAKAELPEINYPVKDLIPEGETIIAAPPKSGKSWFVLDMGLAVADGRKFLGFETNRSDVVYFALEDGEKFEQERLLKVCQNVPENFHFVFRDVVPLDEGFTDQLEQVKAAFPDVRLLIIDTLRFVACRQKKSESAYERDYRTGQTLKTWADDHGVALVVVTHTTKLIHPDDALANVSGTNGVTGAADAIIVIAREKRTDTNATLAVDGRRVRQSEHEIKMDWDSCRWEYIGLADPDERERRRRERELDEIRSSTVYKAALLLADKNVNGWKGNARKLIDDASEYGLFVTEDAKTVGGILTNNIPVFAQDGVRVNVIKNGTGANIYRLSSWQKAKAADKRIFEANEG